MLTGDPEVLANRVALYETSDDPDLVPTVDQLSAEEVASLTEPRVLQLSARSLYTTDNQVWWDNAQVAFCDTSVSLSDVKALCLWCDMTPGVCILGVNNIAERLREASEDGIATRDTEFLKIERANHFVSAQCVRYYPV